MEDRLNALRGARIGCVMTGSFCTFAKAFDVDPPAVGNLTADEALIAFREFTAACMEEALADEQLAAAYRAGDPGFVAGGQLWL